VSGDAVNPVAKFAQDNKTKIADAQKPIVRSQTTIWPNFLTYRIGHALGISYQPVVQIVALNGRVLTYSPVMLD
jgi:hypothetical protein